MGNGLLVQNDTYFVQIDSSYKNMILINKSKGNLYKHTLDSVYAFTANVPFNIRCYSNDSVNCYYDISSEVTNYTFGWQLPNSDKSGLEVYDNKGELVFSSSSKPLKVLEFASFNIEGKAGEVIFSRKYPGKTIAIIPSQIPFNYQRWQKNGRGYSTTFTINGDTLTVTYGITREWFVTSSNATGSANRNDTFQPYVNFLVIDISNF